MHKAELNRTIRVGNNAADLAFLAAWPARQAAAVSHQSSPTLRCTRHNSKLAAPTPCLCLCLCIRVCEEDKSETQGARGEQQGMKTETLLSLGLEPDIREAERHVACSRPVAGIDLRNSNQHLQVECGLLLAHAFLCPYTGAWKYL